MSCRVVSCRRVVSQSPVSSDFSVISLVSLVCERLVLRAFSFQYHWADQSKQQAEFSVQNRFISNRAQYNNQEAVISGTSEID